MGDLAADTEVKGGNGEYQATLSRDWEIWGPNGGYVAAIALRGAGAHSRFDRPANMVGHFLGVGSFDAPLDVRVTTLRTAKRAESIRVELTQGEQRIFEALVWAVGEVDGLAHDTTNIPTTSDPNALISNRERLQGEDTGPYQRFWSNFDERVPDEDWIDDFENRPPSDPLAGGWFRFLPASTFADPWVDACRSVVLLDTMGWPAVCRLHTRPEFMAPSIDLSCAFHRLRPDEPWLYVQARADSAAGGLIGCAAKVWAAGGTLVAVGASQLLCRPWPSS